MTRPMKELLLREFAKGISAVAKRHDIHIDPLALQYYMYKNIIICKRYGGSNGKLHIGYNGMILYKLNEIAKTPEEARKLANYNILCSINYRLSRGNCKQHKLVVEFRLLHPYIRAFNGVHKLSNTLCDTYTDIEGIKRSLFSIFMH